MKKRLLDFIKSSKKAGFVFSIFLIFIFISCRLNIPVKEMTLARSAITRAVEVKSEKYAPEELKKAKEELISSHDSMKIEDVKAAKKAAETSKKYSEEAVTKSLPPLAEDTLNEAKTAYKEANEAFAEKYSAEEYQLAGSKISESESLKADKKYWESYLKSKEAIENAVSARDRALSNIAALKENIERINKEAKVLDSMGGREFAPDEMKDIDANLNGAYSSLDKKNVKEASVKVESADAALKAAAQKTWKAIAAAKIKAAEEAVKNTEKSPYSESFSVEIGNARSFISEGKRLYDNERFNEAASKADEALNILNSVSIAIEKKTEEKRITQESEEETAETTRESNVDASLTGEITEYVVKYKPSNRDCLWKIAMYLYKDARMWPLIYIANKDRIKDPDLIFPGQKLKIPSIRKANPETNTKSDSVPDNSKAAKAESEDKSVILNENNADKLKYETDPANAENENKREDKDSKIDEESDSSADPDTGDIGQ